MEDPISLADAMRRRARWLDDKSNSHMVSGWGDKSSVIAALYEMADVIDSWSGEYLSKEDTETEYNRRRYGYTDEHGNRIPGDYDTRPLTMEERRAIVRDKQTQRF